ncbi:MAG: diguanylate cyclase domain-containing protein [Ferrimicrobium sp.]
MEKAQPDAGLSCFEVDSSIRTVSAPIEVTANVGLPSAFNAVPNVESLEYNEVRHQPRRVLFPSPFRHPELGFLQLTWSLTRAVSSIAVGRGPDGHRNGPVGRRVLLAISGFAVVEFLVRVGSHPVVHDIADVGMVAATAWRARRSSGRRRLSWFLFAAAIGSWEFGASVWLYYHLTMGGQTPFPSVADVGYMGFPVLVLAGLLVVPSPVLSRPGRVRGLIDGLLIAGALFNLSWATVLGSVAHADVGGSLAFVVGLAYPVSDLVVVTVVVLMVTRIRARGSLLLLAIGLGMFVIADSTFAYLTAVGSYTSGDNPLTLGWLVGFVLIGEAALRDRASSEVEPTRTASNLSLLLPYLLAAVGVTVALWEQAWSRLIDLPTLYVAAGLVAVLLIREFILLVENRSLLARVIEQDLELHRQVGILADRALHDALTGLANRTMFYDQLNRAVALHHRDNRPLAVLLCDLNDFKSVNDTFGHPVGDELLVWVAERFRVVSRADDLVARLGGDEFVILVEDGGDPYQLAARLRDVLAEKVTIAGQEIAVTVSIGISQLQPGSATDAEGLIIHADLAMYEDKRRGKGPLYQDQPICHELRSHQRFPERS